MKVTINDHKKIFTIQEEFNQLFPYLKLEFFVKPSTNSITNRFIKQNSKTLGECSTLHHSAEFTIVPGMTVTELEQNFKDIYGLDVQVLRKSGRTWLETTVTDQWTLEEQNRQGEELSKIA